MTKEHKKLGISIKDGCLLQEDFKFINDPLGQLAI